MPGTIRQISALGQSQLAEWEKIADDWIMLPALRFNGERDELHIICPQCDATVYALSEQSITPAIMKAATVAHLRNRHRELDPDA
jgi:hypothetical protein